MLIGERDGRGCENDRAQAEHAQRCCLASLSMHRQGGAMADLAACMWSAGHANHSTQAQTKVSSAHLAPLIGLQRAALNQGLDGGDACKGEGGGERQVGSSLCRQCFMRPCMPQCFMRPAAAMAVG